MNKEIVFTCLCLCLCIAGCTQQQDEPAAPTDISIACWNLQTFGPTKASDADLMTYYADAIDDHDVVILQEIRDKSGEAIEVLANNLPEYTYRLSERAGSTSYKEQYAVFYTDEVTLEFTDDYTTSYQHLYERPPWRLRFRANNWSWTIYTIHTQPENAEQEIDNLETLVQDTTGDTIIIGDLNADGSYYDESPRKHLTDWLWIIGNGVDTTVAANDYTYDRIIINEAAENNYKNWGVMKEVTDDQSDHYLIYAIFDSTIS